MSIQEKLRRLRPYQLWHLLCGLEAVNEDSANDEMIEELMQAIEFLASSKISHDGSFGVNAKFALALCRNDWEAWMDLAAFANWKAATMPEQFKAAFSISNPIHDSAAAFSSPISVDVAGLNIDDLFTKISDPNEKGEKQ